MAPDYRTPTCAYCDERSVEPCPRCGCNACSQHWAAQWCHLCERERVEERDFAVATERLRSAAMRDTSIDGRWNSTDVTFNLLSILLSAVSRPYRTWRAGKSADRAFAKRAAEEIESWRRANAPDARRR